MLRSYDICMAGSAHLAQGLPCQDDRAVGITSDGGRIVAVVSDGLGSEAHSDVASATAARTCATSCMTRLDAGEEGLAALRASFSDAWAAVVAAASARGDGPDQYDCTLCAAVLDGTTGRLLVGNSGDSGAIAACADGTYVPLTSMQRDERGRVFPLCYEERWEFDEFGGVSGVILATDGVLEKLEPPVLAALGLDPVDRRLVDKILRLGPDDAGDPEGGGAGAEELLRDLPGLTDDTTLVVIWDDERPGARRDEAYYEAPDWDDVARKVDERLYR